LIRRRYGPLAPALHVRPNPDQFVRGEQFS
jgi:hypothetical protein